MNPSRDIHDIKQLKYRYFRCLDLKQWDEFADCLMPEVRGSYEDLSFGSRAELVDYMRENLGPGLISMHHGHHPEITVEGDRAGGIWYLEDKVLVPEFNYVLEGAAFYEDTYVRTEAGWRIATTGYRRTYELSYTTMDIASLQIKQGSALRPE